MGQTFSHLLLKLKCFWPTTTHPKHFWKFSLNFQLSILSLHNSTKILAAHHSVPIVPLTHATLAATYPNGFSYTTLNTLTPTTYLAPDNDAAGVVDLRTSSDRRKRDAGYLGYHAGYLGGDSTKTLNYCHWLKITIGMDITTIHLLPANGSIIINVTLRLPRPPWRPCAWLEVCPLRQRQQPSCSLCYWRPPPLWTSRIPRIIYCPSLTDGLVFLSCCQTNLIVGFLVDCAGNIRNFILSPIFYYHENLLQ